jgi:hypothetical protein
MTESLVPAAEQSRKQENCTFVLNVSRLVGATSFLLDAGHELRRATDEEVQVIKNLIQQVQPVHFPFPWEIGTVHGALGMLQEEDWRYHVIVFRGR